ncbi:hypothetical protein L3Q82_011371 [Scortum barcoo]|uniref:Uncharacterized protein n=1 Tax=Scortum barcoo TaxID=214431 RepID=A0ACB8WA08_9TELE|nr:hypothetical protein L3Q82_011371 [Scortum barcoo]
MRPSRNIKDVSSSGGENRSMFLRQLSSSAASFLPASRPALSWSSSASVGLPRFTPPPHPCRPVRGFPPRPPRLPRQVFSGRTPHPLNVNPGDAGGKWRSFHTSAGLVMERADRDREPPLKRRKSAEEKRSVEEREGPRGGSSKREHRSSESGKDSRPQPNHCFKDGGQDRGRSGAEKGVSRENSRDRGVERTRSRDETPNRGRGTHQQEGRKEQPRTQTSESKPEQENPWKVARSDRRSPVGQKGHIKPEKPLQRRWDVCSTDPPPPGDSTAFDFSVMSYNILSQELLQDNAYLYRHCNPTVLPWSHRLPNLLSEIQQHDADIMCLQEVQEDHYENQIKPALQALGYQCEYKKRTGRKPDGCAVIFKSSRLSLLSSNPVEFFRPGDALLDRDNVGLVVLLQPNDATGGPDPSSFICVANTHLLYNPRRGDIKLAQLAILLAEISRLSRLADGSTNPVVLCGDFNSTPQSPLYSFLTAGSLDYRGMQIGMVSGQESSPKGQRLLTSPIWSHSLGIDHQCQYRKSSAESSCSSPTEVEGAISNLTVEDLATKAAVAFNSARIEHGLKLQSSYQHRLMPDGRPEITTCHSRTAMTVDYILYSPEFISRPSLPGGRGLKLLGRLSLVGESELEEVSGLPNQFHSSDHLPLLARFRFRR